MKLPASCLVLVSSILLSGCADEGEVDIQEVAQQVGDVMASIDESGGSSGSISWADPAATGEGRAALRLYARLAPSELRVAWWEGALVPEAVAASCATAATFGACSGTSITRTFGGCTIGRGTFTGNVDLTWAGTGVVGCALNQIGNTLTREPDFTVTGRRGATLTVAKIGTNGQVLTWASGAGASRVFSFSNDGIRRVFTAGGETLFDFTTETTSDITVTGTSRSSRVVSGGTLRVTDNLEGTSCDYTPTAVTWSASCNCPVSGSWAGDCDGEESELEITGCGEATLTIGAESEDLTFDRCYST
ncbi:MAG: hypothetical protein IT285_07160 [Bdellovibrionales bacterium]|nr:hypothetical protein [Bdellovibrionales bacterium]